LTRSAASLRWYYPDQVPLIPNISLSIRKKAAYIFHALLNRIEDASLSINMPEHTQKGVPAHASTPLDKDFFNMMLLSVPALALSSSGSTGRWR
jgi:hypothetical protein